MKENWQRHLPPGIDWRRERKWLLWGGVAASGYSLGFLIAYRRCYAQLFLWDGGKKLLDTSAVMPDFAQVLDGSLAGFLILALCMVALAAYHYAYHYQDGKSIYLMKRLPDGWELHRRCLTLPLLGAIASVCAALLLLLLYFAVYLVFTPKACLPPQQWQNLWSVLGRVWG